MRNLRAIYNRAVDKELTVQRYPFKHVYTGIDKTVKRAVPLEVIRQIRDLDLTLHPDMDYARDLSCSPSTRVVCRLSIWRSLRRRTCRTESCHIAVTKLVSNLPSSGRRPCRRSLASTTPLERFASHNQRKRRGRRKQYKNGPCRKP